MAQGRVTDVKDAAGSRWASLKARNRWLAHLVDAWQRFTKNSGNQFAAAITYFSFLALFPIILLAVSIAGFVLQNDPSLLQKLFDHISSSVPGEFGDTLRKSIQTAIDKRTGVGIIGLAGVLLTGLGWIGNLRAAINAVWGLTPPKRNVVKAKIADLFVLAGLGLGVLVSLGFTAVGTALTDQILRGIGLSDHGAWHYLFKVFGIALGVAGDMVIFSWLLVRLPRATVRARVALRGALFASVGFELLKILGTYTIAKSASSPTAGPFASIVAILVWIQLVARLALYCAAWMATAEPAVAEAGPASVRLPSVSLPAVSLAKSEVALAAPAARSAWPLLGVGALFGGLAVNLMRRPRPSREVG